MYCPKMRQPHFNRLVFFNTNKNYNKMLLITGKTKLNRTNYR